MDEKELIEKYNSRMEEIRAYIHQAIENIDDLEFLQIVEELVSRKYSVPKEVALSQLQIEQLEESKKQIERGEYFTDEQANQIVDA